MNRSNTAFEWFIQLLSQLELEQASEGSSMNKFLDMHMYVTGAFSRFNTKAVLLQLALDLYYEKVID